MGLGKNQVWGVPALPAMHPGTSGILCEHQSPCWLHTLAGDFPGSLECGRSHSGLSPKGLGGFKVCCVVIVVGLQILPEGRTALRVTVSGRDGQGREGTLGRPPLTWLQPPHNIGGAVADPLGQTVP